MSEYDPAKAASDAVDAATKYATDATEGGFPIMWILLLVIVGGVFFYLFKSGIIGKEDKAKIKADIRKLKGEIAAKIAKVSAMDEDDEAILIPPGAPAKDKATRIAEAKALLGEGDAFNQAAAKIAAEP